MSPLYVENKDYSNDFLDVAGIKTQDSVLIIGKPNFDLSILKDSVKAIKVANKESDVNKLFVQEAKFDKVFIMKDNVITEPFVLKVCQLVKENGLIGCFSTDDVLRDFFIEYVERNFQQANIWHLQSDFGTMVLTDARSVPTTWLSHEELLNNKE